MADGTLISWTDATWSPITGCTIVSAGCKNCYAMTLAGGRMRNHWSRKGLTKPGARGPIWTGEVRFNEDWLTWPLHWKKPRMIFTCAHSDLFHEAVPDEWIDKIFAVMALSPQHTFQVLTKRPDRMKSYISDKVRSVERGLTSFKRRDFKICDTIRSDQLNGRLPGMGLEEAPWPLPNVWLGVSVEDQKRADERIPHLLDTLAAVRFISVEPMLGPVDLYYPLTGNLTELSLEEIEGTVIDWVIVGGESGKGARYMDPEWARYVRDTCDEYGVAFFMKQMAKKAPIPDDLLIRQFPDDGEISIE